RHRRALPRAGGRARCQEARGDPASHPAAHPREGHGASDLAAGSAAGLRSARGGVGAWPDQRLSVVRAVRGREAQGEDTMTKILTPPQPAPIMEIARELLPPGLELIVVDPSKPEFYDAAGDAEYYLGSPRHGIGNEFFRAAPKMKLVQLTSAGYDRVDIEAARKAKVPVANNGGANSVAVAEHAVMLMLAVLKK